MVAGHILYCSEWFYMSRAKVNHKEISGYITMKIGTVGLAYTSFY